MSDAADAAPRRLWIAALVPALVGFALSIVLVREHLTVFQGDVAGGLLCWGGGRLDCNIVAASPAAWILGVPTPLWGLLYYVAASALAAAVGALPPGERAAAAAAGLVLALTAVVVDAGLAWIMFARIGAICLNCLATYVVNVVLAIVWWRIEATETAPRAWRDLLLRWRSHALPAPLSPPSEAATREPPVAMALPKLVIAGVAFSVALVAAVMTMRSVHETISDSRDEAATFLQQAASEPPVDMRVFAERPSRGPAEARVTIAVASDFQCSFCRALSARLDALQADHPRDVRVVFLNAPIDHVCNPEVPPHEGHPQACWLARAGVCARRLGKFWEFHDLVYRTLPLPRVDSVTVRARIASVGIDPNAFDRCMRSGEPDRVVARDLALWRSLRMQAVPSLVINGHVKAGGIYPSTLRALVERLLASR